MSFKLAFISISIPNNARHTPLSFVPLLMNPSATFASLKPFFPFFPPPFDVTLFVSSSWLRGCAESR